MPPWLEVALTVIGVFAAVAGVALTVWQMVRTQAAADKAATDALIAAAYERGVRSRDAEVGLIDSRYTGQLELMRSQRDDARRDRDEAQRALRDKGQ